VGVAPPPDPDGECPVEVLPLSQEGSRDNPVAVIAPFLVEKRAPPVPSAAR